MSTPQAYRLLSPGFAVAYATTMRPYLLFVSGITGICGMSLVAGLPAPHTVLIGIATFLSYGFGQALTDCFQVDTDSISSPYRPLTQGTVTRRQVMSVSLAGLALCVGILSALNPWNLLLGALAGGGLATYTPFKRRWWGGPWYNAWIVAVLGIMAFIAARDDRALSLPPTLPWTLSAIFFGYANFVLAGYFKDISADASSGYDTFPVRFGRGRASVASTALAALAIVSLLGAKLAIGTANAPTLSTVISWVLLAGSIAASATAQIFLHRVRADAESHRAIGLVVHAYILGLASLAAAAQPAWAIALIGFYLAFVLVLKARPSRSQV
jgi:4-hydroxybenzoate polyprenyltransferase